MRLSGTQPTFDTGFVPQRGTVHRDVNWKAVVIFLPKHSAPMTAASLALVSWCLCYRAWQISPPWHRTPYGESLRSADKPGGTVHHRHDHEAAHWAVVSLSAQAARHGRWRRHNCRRHSGARRSGAGLHAVIPGRAEREPGIHPTAILAAPWIPGSRRFASRPGTTRQPAGQISA